MFVFEWAAITPAAQRFFLLTARTPPPVARGARTILPSRKNFPAPPAIAATDPKLKNGDFSAPDQAPGANAETRPHRGGMARITPHVVFNGSMPHFGRPTAPRSLVLRIYGNGAERAGRRCAALGEFFCLGFGPLTSNTTAPRVHRIGGIKGV